MKLVKSWDQYYQRPYVKIWRINATFPSDYYIYNSKFFNSNERLFSFEILNGEPKLLLESCNFCNVRVNTEGPVLFFNSQGQCVQSQLCAINCSTYEIKMGHFSYVDTVLNSNNKNYILISSFDQIGEGEGFSVLRVYNGSILFSSINITRTNAYRSFISHFKSKNDMNYLKFCNFGNSSSINNFGVAFNIGNYLTQYCIFRECSVLTSFLYGEDDANTTIESSIFDDVKSGTNLVSIIPPSQFTLTNCLFRNVVGSTKAATVLNPLESNLFIIQKFLSTIFCEAENPIDTMELCIVQSQIVCIKGENSILYSIFIVAVLE